MDPVNTCPSLGDILYEVNSSFYPGQSLGFIFLNVLPHLSVFTPSVLSFSLSHLVYVNDANRLGHDHDTHTYSTPNAHRDADGTRMNEGLRPGYVAMSFLNIDHF
jgi:hypothetical protein